MLVLILFLLSVLDGILKCGSHVALSVLLVAKPRV